MDVARIRLDAFRSLADTGLIILFFRSASQTDRQTDTQLVAAALHLTAVKKRERCSYLFIADRHAIVKFRL